MQLTAAMQFSIISKLNTNYALTKDEATILKKELAKPEEKLRDLDAAITQLQLELADLAAHKELVRKEVESYTSAIAPIRRILPEILQEIFVHCLPSAHNSVMSGREAPLLLGRVCSRWRQIVYLTPRLWTSIHIVIHRRHIGSPLNIAPSLQDISSWLSRSGALPLSISVSCPGGIDGLGASNNLEVESYLDLLSSFSSRWKSLHLSIPNFDLSKFLSRYSASDVPLLERIHFQGNGRVEPGEPGIALPQEGVMLARDDGILRAPRLRLLSLPLCFPGLWKLPIRWDALTGLRLLGDPSRAWALESQDVLKTLMLCPHLEICSVLFCSSSSLSQPGAPHVPINIHLPKLRSLSISDDSMGQASSDLLKRLHAPILRHFRYMTLLSQHFFPPAPGTYNLLDALSSFLSRLISPLEELELATLLATMDIIQILRMFPGLKRLSLKDNYAELNSSSPPFVHDPWLPSNTQRPLFRDYHLKELTPQRSQKDGEQESTCDTGSHDLPELQTHIQTPSPPSEEIKRPASSICLCPKLEVFYCSGAGFSDSVLLDFLRSRSVDREACGMSRLKMVKVMLFRRRLARKTRKQIQALTHVTGMSVDVTDSPLLTPPDPRPYRHSPYDGLHMFDTM